MALSIGQWAVVRQRAENKLERAERILHAAESGQVYPGGLPGDNEFARAMPGALESSLRAKFLSLIDEVIADLTAARNAP